MNEFTFLHDMTKSFPICVFTVLFSAIHYTTHVILSVIAVVKLGYVIGKVSIFRVGNTFRLYLAYVSCTFIY